MMFVPKHEGGLAAYFKGGWKFFRKISDHKTGIEATVNGTVVFSGNRQILNYAEIGSMEYGGYKGQARQNYLYQFTSPATARVLFKTNRLFHELDLSTGQSEVGHLCQQDRYDGHYRLRDAANWSLDWKIVGPRKNCFISTDYHRM